MLNYDFNRNDILEFVNGDENKCKIVEYIIYLYLSTIYYGKIPSNEEIHKCFIFENRDNKIFGLKKENERLRFYFTKDEILVIPTLKKKISLVPENSNEIVVSFNNLKNKENNNGKVFALSDNKENINDRYKKYYDKVENAIINVLKENGFCDKSDLYKKIFYAKPKFINKILKQSKKIIVFSNYIELTENIKIKEEEIDFVKSVFLRKFKENSIIKAKEIYNILSGYSFLLSNGIDDYQKFYQYCSKIISDFYYYDKKYEISINKIENSNNIEIKEFDIEEYLDIDDFGGEINGF